MKEAVIEEATEQENAEAAGATAEIIPLATRTKEGMANLVKVLKGLPGVQSIPSHSLQLFSLLHFVCQSFHLSVRGLLQACGRRD